MSETPEDVYRAAAEAWVIAHRFEPPLDDLGLRHFTRKAMGQPDLRAAVDAAYAAGREARDAGPCMDSSPRFFGCTPLLCELRAGHTGGHECGTTRWTKAEDVERARSERDAYEAGFEAGREAAAQDHQAVATRLDAVLRLIEEAQARGEFAVQTGALLDVLMRLDVATEIARGGR